MKKEPALAYSLWFSLRMWQKKALTASMHGQFLSPPPKKGFYIRFSACIYICYSY
ncbi:hypothetical protein ACIGHG_05225 [Bacillus sp. NPDC077411]|uniref:hypothetical protein n=1 Tax=unclassified Bacillus (in: firmicutes) TaxID=185979 RepID=UPI00147AAD58|nr:MULTISPECIES: hypothetical protein [unclassified Bacillus (in: firmicutes)]